MLIKESTLRRIIKEEARRVLREGVTPATSTATSTATPDAATTAWMAVNVSLLKLQGGIANIPAASGNITRAIAGWAECRAPSSPKAKAVLEAINANSNKNSNTQLGYALAALAEVQVYSAAANTILADDPITAVAGSDRTNVFVEAITPLSAGIITNMKVACTPSTTPADLIYTVKPGDSLSKILGAYYSIPVSQASMPLYKAFANIAGIGDPNTILKGQRITLPKTLTISGKSYNRKLDA
jgi:nucleoid-associated protein YgaU